ncbi:hypothetical protein CIL03_14310 [Virgibacillus indicus]|uniref:Uncharacterized protein n=1 Tax=Virgibacillus indicus TaxID=2024554 RepID=A0A265N7A3_9BACI|nr:Ger(x)C family spore germination protein [Virgibacillus indicus]OZU87873.1 hypothetical protein CIL03_14310 [Virgibacillus indicus]
MYRKILIIAMVSLLFLTACPESKVIENQGIINTRGIDINPDQENQIETTLIVYQFDDQATNITKTLYGVGHTIKAAREKANESSSFNLTPGQIRLNLFGRELAEQGIIEYISAMISDARISDTMLLAVADSSAKEILTEGQKVTSINVGQYLHGVIDREHKEETLPRVELNDFSHIYNDVGIDPILPVIGSKNGEPVKTSIALFQDDKYVKELPLVDGLLVNLFQKTIGNAPLELKLPMEPFREYEAKKELHPSNSENLYVRIGLNGKSQTKLTDFEEKHFKTTINLGIILEEFSELISMKDEKAADLLEKEIAKQIEGKYETLLKKVQEANADPFGFGNIYRTHRKAGDLTKKEWREIFPTISVDFNVNVEVLNYGTTK